MTKYIYPAFVVLLLIACSTARVSSDYDGTANFASYKTFSFTKDAEQLPVSDLNRRRVLDAVYEQMNKEGFGQSDKPDVWIDLKILAKEKESATATNTSPYGAGYGYRWGGGFSTTTINVEKYVEGTLFVDMIDVSKKQLVWQGRAVGVLDPNASAQKRSQNIIKVIEDIFATYPPK